MPYPGPTSGINTPKGISSSLLIDVCSSALSADAGTCLARLHDPGQTRFEDGAVKLLCKSKDAMAKMGCLKALRRQYLSLDDVRSCVSQDRVVSGLKVAYFLSEDDKQEATAGKRFALRFKLFDQWGQPLQFLNPEDEVTLSAGINENNPQGAVLWGIRSNMTRGGELQLNHLMISQPGKVSFRISTNNGRDSIASFSLTVKEDPHLKYTARCVAFFRQLSCPVDMRESDWQSYFPRVKGVVSGHSFYDLLMCSETFAKWHVGLFPVPSGDVWLEFKAGIEAIWTGTNLPMMEQTFEQRLELPPASSMKLKDIRRAYYRKSLQWHPDRWAGMPIYSVVVQGAFQLINEAYEHLSLLHQNTSKLND